MTQKQTQRFITGGLLILLLIFALWMGGWVFSLLYMVTICLSMYEMFHALGVAGHQVVQWPSWLCMLASIPLFQYVGSVSLLMPLVGGAYMLTSFMVIFRGKPKLEDILISCMPLISVLLPGMCMLGLQNVSIREMQLLCTIEAFGIPLFGDICAYLVGSRIGRRPLCPEVSPHKTLEGAAAGLAGSIVFAAAAAGIFSLFAPVPAWWHFLVLGLLCGIAGQMGDLFASLVKRHCGIKDYSNIFPGHGGMMDRLDSVYWATVIMYIYANLFIASFPAA